MKIEVFAGAGGQESEDFARMLREMYAHWCNRAGFRIWKRKHGLTVNAYGAERLRGEEGVHRLVRVSPFDPEKRRHTSFAFVVVDGEPLVSDSSRRSYVLHPYELVKDHSTGAEYPNPSVIFSGRLEELWNGKRGEKADG